jgi:MoaA/NifB/PqqE/SkfB family radical SAM enzyme
MESIYYVMSWACHRRCKHCYEGRFRPYVRDELEAVVREAEANFPRIIDHLPERLIYRDPELPLRGGGFAEKPGRVILSGGESLLDPVRERVTYKVIERLTERYRGQNVRIIVQTTGDLLDDAIVGDLLARGTWMISVAGIDEFHVGMETVAKRNAMVEKLTRLFERHGMRTKPEDRGARGWLDDDGPMFSFFGATPDSWIGKLWPRGRAWANGLGSATIADNFCNRWSGGLGFLDHRHAGSEVSIEPDGNVYPCCVKTKLPIGNLLEEKLLDILDSLVGDPVYEAISMGHPERMGITAGWSVEKFLAKSVTATPQGKRYENLCIGCDAFHAEVLAPRIEAARSKRRALRVAAG